MSKKYAVETLGNFFIFAPIGFWLGFYLCTKIIPPLDIEDHIYLLRGVDYLIDTVDDADAVRFHCEKRAKLFERYGDALWGVNPKCGVQP